jgi:hypothetical protein
VNTYDVDIAHYYGSIQVRSAGGAAVPEAGSTAVLMALGVFGMAGIPLTLRKMS